MSGLLSPLSPGAEATSSSTTVAYRTYRPPLRAKRPSATYSSWTRLDAPDDGPTCLSCVARSRSMRRTDDVSKPLCLVFLRANGDPRPHPHSALRRPDSRTQHQEALDRLLCRLHHRPVTDHTLAARYNRRRWHAGSRRLPGQRLPRLGPLRAGRAGTGSCAASTGLWGSRDPAVGRSRHLERLVSGVSGQRHISQGYSYTV